MTTVKLSDITPDDRNANAHTERGTYMLRRSIERFGFLEPGVLDANNRIIGGNNRTEAAVDVLDASEAVVIDIDGTRPVFVRRRDLDLTTPEGREAAIALNRTAQVGIEFDPLAIASLLVDDVDLSDWFHDGELDALLADAVERHAAALESMGDGEGANEATENGSFAGDAALPSGVPDSLWPTDNEWGIPLLSIERQADAFDLPIETWGAKGRKVAAGTYHFYTEDYRFAAIWDRPGQLVAAGCVNAVEPNFSVYDQVPRAVALWATYRKRWLARYWQSQGIRIFVDLNVARPYDDLNLLGVPKGWRAYATRGYTSRLDMLAEELEIARTHAGTRDVLFMVYGGGDKVRQWCSANVALWLPEDMDRAKGKYINEGAGRNG
jgi:hypothetical protein